MSIDPQIAKNSFPLNAGIFRRYSLLGSTFECTI